MRIENVCKSFGGRTVLDDVSISAQSNHITGLFGKDEAGKTALIDAITGRLIPDGGSISFSTGTEYTDYREVSGDIALVREELVTDTYFTIGMYIDDVRKVYPDMDIGLLHSILARFNLDIRSRVMFLIDESQVELQIAIAIARRPKLIILDEPFTGLYRKASDSVKALLSQYMKEYGGTLFVTAYSRDDIDDLCDDLYELNDGVCSCIRSGGSGKQSVLTESHVNGSIRMFQEKRAVVFAAGMMFASCLNAFIAPHSSSLMLAVSSFELIFCLCCTLFISGSDLFMVDAGQSRQTIIKTANKTILICFATGFLCALLCCGLDPVHSLSVLVPFALVMPLSILILYAVIIRRIPFGLFANVVIFIFTAIAILSLGICGDYLYLPTVIGNPVFVLKAYVISISLTLLLMRTVRKDYLSRYLKIKRPPVRVPKPHRLK